MADKKKICYFPNWAQYRPGRGEFMVPDIDPSVCTHIVYAFAIIDGLQLVSRDANDAMMYAQMQALKTRCPDLVTMISVGGESMGDGPFIHVSSTPDNRRQFAANAVKYARAHGFGGIDIDWEFPRSEDRDNFSQLIKELKTQFDAEGQTTRKPTLVLSAALAANREIIHGSYDVESLGRYLDIANIMTYNLHGAWDRVTGFHSALHGANQHDIFSQEWVISEYLSRGMPSGKMVLGIPTYGHTFKLSDVGRHGVREPATGEGNPGDYTHAVGTLAYYEIRDLLSAGYTRRYDDVQQMPYAYKGDQWICYEDPQSIAAKSDFVHVKRLGGYMFWDISMDDFHNGYPLITAAR